MILSLGDIPFVQCSILHFLLSQIEDVISDNDVTTNVDSSTLGVEKKSRIGATMDLLIRCYLIISLGRRKLEILDDL